MKKRYAVIILLCALICVPTSAHSGRTDSKGGHTNHSTGEYHYHHGYPEHQHTNGICPYDYKNAEKGSAAGGQKTSKTPSASAAIKSPTATKEKSLFQNLLSVVVFILKIILALLGNFVLFVGLLYVGQFVLWLFKFIYRLLKKLFWD